MPVLGVRSRRTLVGSVCLRARARVGIFKTVAFSGFQVLPHRWFFPHFRIEASFGLDR